MRLLNTETSKGLQNSVHFSLYFSVNSFALKKFLALSSAIEIFLFMSFVSGRKIIQLHINMANKIENDIIKSLRIFAVWL